MGTMRYELRCICKANRDGSFATQQDRLSMLVQAADYLEQCGFRQLTPSSLKAKHVNALVAYYKQSITNKTLSIATVKNRLSALRWLLDKVNKSHLLPKDNAWVGIGRRCYQKSVTDNKAQSLTAVKANLVNDRAVYLGLCLQEAFGLRREECIKFNAAYADQGDHVRLKASWTKGGRARVIPIRTQAQRDLLNEVSAFAGNASLIPSHKTYIEQRRHYDYVVKRAGLNNMHGLRHGYAQERYRELAQFEPPIAGGKTAKEYMPFERERDLMARGIITEELGHGRLSVTSQYLGR